jgi:very-short-patch-repair endonuclease
MAWRLTESQHGVVTRRQLLAAGFSSDEIDGRLAHGKLHRLWRGVYAVGRPRLTLLGWWSAAVLACGADAALSHESAAALWGIREPKAGDEGEQDRPQIIHVSVSAGRSPRRVGIQAHRRRDLSRSDRARFRGIRVTTPARTLIDVSTVHRPDVLEAYVNTADRIGLIDPDSLRVELDERRGMDGVPRLRGVLDRHTFRLTDSELERRFLGLVRRVRLPDPLTQQRLNGFRVDFYWPDLDLVVETDGLTYHRTPAQQSKDRVRDQRLAGDGYTVLRFTHAQIKFDPGHVAATLHAVVKRVSSDFPAVSRAITRDQP